jgi:hypothetical protein
MRMTVLGGCGAWPAAARQAPDGRGVWIAGRRVHGGDERGGASQHPHAVVDQDHQGLPRVLGGVEVVPPVEQLPLFLSSVQRPRR